MKFIKYIMVIAMKDKHYIYILECKDNTYYTGYTNCINDRLEKHQKGKAAKYTRGRRPVKLIYCEQVNSKSQALKREYKIKKLTRLQKEKLIKEDDKNGYPKEFYE